MASKLEISMYYHSWGDDSSNRNCRFRETIEDPAIGTIGDFLKRYGHVTIGSLIQSQFDVSVPKPDAIFFGKEETGLTHDDLLETSISEKTSLTEKDKCPSIERLRCIDKMLKTQREFLGNEEVEIGMDEGVARRPGFEKVYLDKGVYNGFGENGEYKSWEDIIKDIKRIISKGHVFGIDYFVTNYLTYRYRIVREGTYVAFQCHAMLDLYAPDFRNFYDSGNIFEDIYNNDRVCDILKLSDQKIFIDQLDEFLVVLLSRVLHKYFGGTAVSYRKDHILATLFSYKQEDYDPDMHKSVVYQYTIDLYAKEKPDPKTYTREWELDWSKEYFNKISRSKGESTELTDVYFNPLTESFRIMNI